MAITRAQQVRQMLKNGGRGISLQEAKDMAPKGEFLAYINKKEAKMLKDAGGSGIMTNAGIPSYFVGAERDARAGRGDISPGTDRGGNQRNGNNNNYQDRIQTIAKQRAAQQKAAQQKAIRDKETRQAQIRAKEKQRQQVEARERQQKQAQAAYAARVEKAKKERREKIISLADIPTPFNIAKKIGKKIFSPLTNIQRQKYIDTQLVPGTKEYTNFMEQLVDQDAATINVPDFQQLGYTTRNLSKVDFDDGSKFGFGEGYDNYRDTIDTRFNTDDRGDNDGSNQLPPIISQQPITPVTPLPVVGSTTSSDPFSLAPRFMGSIFDFSGGRTLAADGGMMKMRKEYRDLLEEDEMEDPTGGIMDLETGRQQYFLGKLVKKATRAVKKVAKSPIGKAALGYALTGGLGNLAGGSGFGGMFKGFMSPSKFLAKNKLSGIFSKGGAKNILFGGKNFFGERARDYIPSSGILGSGGKFSIGKALGLGIGLPAALDLMGVGKEEEDGIDLDEYYKTQGIDIDAIRNNPDRILARRFMAEGGDAEPVAKKTMPLIDMDGMEKDYREDGGFVPIGRMERADDVPARLSKNEFVFTADAVRNAGEGDIDKGAEVMYNMMKNLESGGEVSEESQGLDGAREMFQTSQRLEEVL